MYISECVRIYVFFRCSTSLQ